MNKLNTLNTVASSLALALALGLGLGLATAAHADDFDDAYPAFAEARAAQKATPAQASAQRVADTAGALKRSAGAVSSGSVSTEESRAMTSEDSGSFWMAQQVGQPAGGPALAKVGTGKR